jgi:hypothetical protein
MFGLRYIVGVAIALVVGRYIDRHVEQPVVKWLVEFVLAGILISWMSGEFSRWRRGHRISKVP